MFHGGGGGIQVRKGRLEKGEGGKSVYTQLVCVCMCEKGEGM